MFLFDRQFFKNDVIATGFVIFLGSPLGLENLIKQLILLFSQHRMSEKIVTVNQKFVLKIDD